MKSKTFIQLLLFGSLLTLTASACGGAQPTPYDTPAPVTQVVTRQVVQEVTREVTKIVEVQATTMPEPTLPPTAAPDPNQPASSLPLATLPAYTDCFYGPASWYEYQSSFAAGQPVEVKGRSEDSAWLNVQEQGGWNSCWIDANQAQLAGVAVESLPVVASLPPVDFFDLSSPYASAKRDDDEVTLSWKAVYMSLDEIKGYLIRAKLCQGGQIVPQDIFIPMTFEENKGTLTYTLTDEGGCSEPSDIRMISYTRRGLAGYYNPTMRLGWEKVFFPPHP